MDDEKYYERVAEEMRSGEIREGLWTKVLSSADGNEQAAKARYIKLRVEQLVSLDREAASKARGGRLASVRGKALAKVFGGLLISFLFWLWMSSALHDLPDTKTSDSAEFQDLTRALRDLPDVPVYREGTNWDDIARQLNPDMPVEDYNKVRVKFFHDVILPKIGKEYSPQATYEYFLKQTERPKDWAKKYGSMIGTLLLPGAGMIGGIAFVISGARLVIRTWRGGKTENAAPPGLETDDAH
jgi:hypothetical protein